MSVKYYTTFSNASTGQIECVAGDNITERWFSLSESERERVDSIIITRYPYAGCWKRKYEYHVSASWERINGKFVPKTTYKVLKRQQEQIDTLNKRFLPFQQEQVAIGSSSIWQAEADKTVGSKVGNGRNFRAILLNEIESHVPSLDRVPGQLFITLNKTQIKGSAISSGVGLRSNGYYSNQVENYVMREWRGQVQCFLQRRYALPVESCAVIVYTREAYLSDPQISWEERFRVEKSHFTHFLVALLAQGEGVPNARSPYRLVDCLADGNNEASTWSLEEIRKMAGETIEYASRYSVVAD